MSTSAPAPNQTLTGSLWDKAFNRLDENLRSSLGQAKTHKRDILAAVLRAAEDKRDKSLQGRWEVKLPNREVVIVRDVLEKITRWVVRFREVGDIAVQYDPTHASLPWAAVRFLLQATVNDIQQYGAMLVDIEVISRLITRYKEFELLYLPRNAPVAQPLDDVLTSLYTEVLVYLARTIDILSERTLVRLAKAPFRLGDEEQMQRILKRENEVWKIAKLNDTEKLRSMEISLVRLIDQASINSQVLDIERHGQIVRWLSTSPNSVHHETILETRGPNFGQWLLKHEDYKDWWQSSSSSVFLLVGIPGSGKTHLCSTVVDELLKGGASQALSAPFAYFYCLKTDSEPGRSSVDEILRNILRQVAITDASTQPRVRCMLDVEFEQRSKSAQISGLDPSRLKTKECVDLIIEIVNDDPVTIVLDAIDQVQDAQRLVLFDAINRILRDAANVVKIFLTSRHDTELSSSFSAAKMVSTNSANMRGDMQQFIHRELDHAKLMNGCASSEVRKALTEKLLAGAGEMFLWAHRQIQQLRMRKIKQEEDLLPALKTNILADLDQLYEETLQQVLSGGDMARSFVIQVFSWLLYMKSPLTLSTLIAAVSASKTSSAVINPVQVSDMCAHLVVADTKHDTVRFAHQSIEEYLLRNKQDLFSPCMSHGLLASTCIKVCSRGPPHGQPLEVRILSIYVYAAIYWAMHFKGAEVLERNSDLFTRMLSFVVDEDDMMPSLSFEIWMDTAAKLASLLPNYHPMKPVLDALPNEQSSPVFLAAVFGVDGLLKLLAESNIEIDWNQRNKRGHTAVYLAAAFGNASTVSILINQGGEINVECGRHGSPLHAACYGGHEDVVKRLLSHNASVTCGETYENALDASARGGNENIALILVQSGTIKTDADYEYALQAATEFGFIGLLAELQKPNFKPFRQNDMIDKQKARMTRAIKSGQLGVLTEVASGVSDPSTLFEASAVATAASYGHNDIIRFLLSIGMGIEAEGEFGTPLRSACLMGRKSTVQLLIEQGAGINSTSLENDVLHAAASKGHAAIVGMLLQEGADVNRRGGTFGSALHAAAYNGHKEVVQMLLDAGAEIHTGYYCDIFHAAVEGGRQDVVLFLLKRGYHFNDPISRGRRIRASAKRTGPMLPTQNLFTRAPQPTSPEGSHHSYHYTEPKYPELGSALLNPSEAAGRTSAVRLLLDHRRHLKIGEDDIMGMVKAAAAHGHVDALKALVEWLKRQGPIDRYQSPIFQSIREGESPDTMRFAMSLTSENGLPMEYANKMVNNWPPSPEKDDTSVVDKNQLNRDFMRTCASGDKDSASSILECRYRAPLDREDFAKAIELAAEAGNELLLSALFHHIEFHELCLLKPLVLSNAPFFAATNKGHLKILKLLLSRSEQSRCNSQLLGKLAYRACTEGHADIVKYLVEELGVDGNMAVADDTRGFAALDGEHSEPIGSFCKPSNSQPRGMFETIIEDVIETELSAGEQQTRTGRFINLLQSSLRAFERYENFGRVYLSEEESSRRTEVVACLLANGADPSSLGGQDAFPIQVAAKLCPATVIRKLIDAGADVMCVHVGESALDAAIERDSDSANIVRMILEAGRAFLVDLESGRSFIERVLKVLDRYRGHIWDNDSRLFLKPCFVDAFENGPGAVLELLLHQYPEYKTEHEIFICVLQIICLLGKQNFVELLLARGADPNRSGYYYGTPIQAAARSGQLEIVRLLLRHGASVNAVQGRWDTALRAAAIGGHSDVVNLLVSHGADINLKGDTQGSSLSDDENRAASALQLAVASGDMDTVNVILGAGADVNEDVSCLSRPPVGQEHRLNLEIASLKSAALLDVSAKPRFPYANTSDPMEDYIRSLGRWPRKLAVGTALLLAVEENDLHMTRRLLAAGAQINSISTGRNALLEAIEKGAEPSIVREPLAKGAMAVESNHPNRLNSACDGKRVDLIELLLESIYDNHDQPETIVDEALTALVLQDQPDDATLKLLLEYLPPTQERFAKVCFSGLVSNVLFMLDAGMSINGEENEHHPIHLASRWLLDEVVQILVQRGANIHFKSPKWGTPLLCALSSCAEPFFKEFQSESALSKVLPSDDRGGPQRHIWRFHSTPVANIQTVIQCKDIVQLLVDNGAGPNIDDCAFGTPLHIACLIGSADIVTMLLNVGADVNAVSGYFGTPLFAAMHGEHSDVVSLLLEHEADVNYVHQAHGTPLHFACAIDDGAMTRRLLQHGASAAMLNQAGQTALTLALKGHRRDGYWRDSTSIYRSRLYSLVQEAPQSIQPSEHDILDAARINVDPGPLAWLLQINKDIFVSEDLIVRLVQTERFPNEGNLRLLLERSGGLGITERMLMVGPCLDTWTGLFQTLPVCKISPTILESQREIGSFEFLLDIADNIDITEGVVLKAIDLSDFYPWRRSTTSVLATIWERKPSMAVTQPMLKTAKVTSVLEFLLRRFGPANGMLQDVAFSIAARRDGLVNDAADMLCLLLRHDLQIKLSSEIVAKVMGSASDCTTLESFLTHDPGLPITEELFLETLLSRRMRYDPSMIPLFAETLCRHGKKVILTQKMRDAIDCVDIAMQIKQMFYDLSGGEETAGEGEARSRKRPRRG